MATWEPTKIDKEYKTHLCPKCKQRTESLIEIEQDEYDDKPYPYDLAERCKVCGWIVRFDEDQEAA